MGISLSGDVVTRALLFGKLPAHGDFVTRGLSSVERDFWDGGLSHALDRARQCHGDSFSSLYESASPWRCVIEDHNGWIGGALALSMDGTGRLYPILLACRLSGPEKGAAIAAACEELLYEAIASGWTADILYQRAKAMLSNEHQSDGSSYIGWWLDGDKELNNPPSRFVETLPPDLINEMLQVKGKLS